VVDSFRVAGAAVLALVMVFGMSARAAAEHAGPVTAIVSAGGEVFSCSQAGIVSETEAGSEVVFRPPFRVTSLAVAGSDLLLVGGGEPGEYGMVGLYDRRSKEFDFFEVAKDVIYAVAVAPSGTLAAVACADHRVLTFALPVLEESSVVVRHRHTGAARAVRFSPDGKYLVSAGLDGAVLLSEVVRGGEPMVLQDHSSKVDCLAFSPDSTHFASGGRDGKVRVHRVDGRLVRTYQGMGVEMAIASEVSVNASIWALAWGGAPESLIAGSAAGAIYRLSVDDDSWARLRGARNGPVYSLAILETRRIAVGGDGVEIRKFE
jgi:hypothetical protein